MFPEAATTVKELGTIAPLGPVKVTTSAAVKLEALIASLKVKRTELRFAPVDPENAADVTRAPVVSVGGGGGLLPWSMAPTFSRRPLFTVEINPGTTSAELSSFAITSAAVLVGLASQ